MTKKCETAASRPNCEIAAVGEVLWDVFPSGARFGGAPANFACSLAGLAPSARISMVSAVGRDDLGETALAELAKHHVDAACVSRLDKPTGNVLIQLDGSGSASYEFAVDCAWDNIEWTDNLQHAANRVAAVCFGTLGQRGAISRKSIQQFVATTSPDALRVFDINLRPPYFTDEVIVESLELANVLKLNDEELPILAELFDLMGSDVERLRQLSNRFQLSAVALTLGSSGALLLRDGEFNECPGISAEVCDTVGAGDAYTAMLVLGLLNHMELRVINQNACEVAAFVCSQAGATPKIPSRFVLEISRS